MTTDEAPGVIWIVSTRGPDDEPVCELTWDALQWYAPVEDVRQTAIDLVTCAAYAEMMMQLVVPPLKLPPDVVSVFMSDLLHTTGRREEFGAATTIRLMPAGSSKRREALVLLRRGSQKAMVGAAEARGMATAWMSAAEATESDQLVAEAFRATQKAGDLDQMFGYLRKLRDQP